MKRRKASVLGFLRYMMYTESVSTKPAWHDAVDLWANGPEKISTKHWGPMSGNTMIIVMFYVMLSSWGPWLLDALYWPVAVVLCLGIIGYMVSAKKQTETSPADKFADAVGWSSYEIKKADRRDKHDEQREHKHRV